MFPLAGFEPAFTCKGNHRSTYRTSKPVRHGSLTQSIKFQLAYLRKAYFPKFLEYIGWLT